MTEVKDQQKIIENVVGIVTHPVFPASLNVVAPPGFRGDTIADEVTRGLRSHGSQPIVARIVADSVRGVEDYVRELHQQWSRDIDIAPIPTDAAADTQLSWLLNRLSGDRRIVQVIDRFHKVLDRLPEWVLGLLRNAEQAHRLYTVTLAPLAYADLKQRWRDLGHHFVVSDYGDTHSVINVEPAEEAELMAKCQSAQMPHHITRLGLVLTGGYPEAFDGVLDLWRRERPTRLTPAFAAEARKVAEQRLQRFVGWIDRNGENVYRDSVIKLYHGVDVEDACFQLAHHPWSRILVRDQQLRAEAVGSAAVEHAIRSAVQTGKGFESIAVVYRKAVEYYSHHQYADALRAVRDFTTESAHAHLRVLWAHARIMNALFADGVDAGTDTDWNAVRQTVTEARASVISSLNGQPAASLFGARYDELIEVSTVLSKVVGKDVGRCVDALVGLVRGSSIIDVRNALLLILINLESARAASGHTTACSRAVAIPEQVFRVWAYWRVGINYYSAPDGQGEIWDDVISLRGYENFRRPAMNQPFSSFESFAYFALLKAQRDGISPGHLIEPDLRALEQALGLYGQVRNSLAHSVCSVTPRQRSKYFDLMTRWVDQTIAAAPIPLAKDQVLGLIEPLPLLDSRGKLIA